MSSTVERVEVAEVANKAPPTDEPVVLLSLDELQEAIEAKEEATEAREAEEQGQVWAEAPEVIELHRREGSLLDDPEADEPESEADEAEVVELAHYRRPSQLDLKRAA